MMEQQDNIPTSVTPRPVFSTGGTALCRNEHHKPISPNYTPNALTALADYRFIECVSGNPVCTIWDVETPEGDEKTLYLLNIPDHGRFMKGLPKLQNLQHDGLPTLEYFAHYGYQAVLITPARSMSLWDRWRACRKQGKDGVPLPELLFYLEQVAAIIDSVYVNHGIYHLWLQPQHILVDTAQARVEGYGIMTLLSVKHLYQTPLNGRYAAPEIYQARLTPSSDQFSLGLIYAEMRTGIHPLAKHVGIRGGLRARRF